MKSDTITISTADIGQVLDLVKRTVSYIGYPDEYAQRMSLLAEELINSNKAVIEETHASLWVETNEENMEIHLKLEGDLSAATREKLVEISKSQCNQPPEGIMAKIGAFFSDAFMQQTAEYTPLFMVDGEIAGNLNTPFSVISNDDTENATEDDREEHLLKGLADDITVCAWPTHAETVVVKKLPLKKQKITKA